MEITFDFIYSFENWLIDIFTPLFTWIFDPLNGSYYEFITAQSVQYIAYMLFIVSFVIVIWFALGFVKSVYYFVKEIF
jgi:hypothetical protein